MKWKVLTWWGGVGVLFAVVASALPTMNAEALPKSEETFYNDNNFMFYDSEACATSELGQSGGEISGGGSSVSGTVATEKVWSALKSLGWSDEAVAGAMGNILAESKFNVAVHQGTGGWKPVLDYGPEGCDSGSCIGHAVGLIQWDGSRRARMYNYVVSQKSELADYLNDAQTSSTPPYGCDGDCYIERVGSSIYDALLKLEVDFLKSEIDGKSIYQRFLDQPTAIDAAKMWADYVEVSHDSCNPNLANATCTYGEDLASETSHRLSNANKFYELYAGKNITGIQSSTMVENEGENVTIIGDSITLGALNYGSFAAVGLGNADVEADNSKSLDAGGSGGTGNGKPGKEIISDMAANGELRYVVVVALGTNGAGTMTASRIQSDIIDPINASGEHLIVLVTNFVASGRTDLDFTSNNNGMREAGRQNDNVVMADWAAVASDDIISNDGLYVHPTPDGSKLFAQTIYKAMTNGSVTAAVKSYKSQCTNGKINYSGGNGVTTTMIGGTRYAFPIAYATKRNYLSNTTEHPSVLSSPNNNWMHHDTTYRSVDIGIYYADVIGHDFQKSDYPQWDRNWTDADLAVCDASYGAKHCNSSTGAAVVAIADGVVTRYEHYKGTGMSDTDQEVCAKLHLQAADGRDYYYTHLGYEDEFADKVGQSVSVGDVIGHIGLTRCADHTQAHAHIWITGDNSETIANLMSQLYQVLPEDMEELTVREASGGTVGDGGLTYEQAKQFMINYGANKNNSSMLAATSGLWGMCNGGGSNCVTFSAFFLNKFTNTNVGSSPGNGHQVVGTLGSKGVVTGTEPQVWAVFSWSGGEWGHTGVVLGHHDGQWIVGHASCSNTGIGAGDGTKVGGGSGFVVMSEDIQTATLNGSNLKFAYLDDQVDIEAIENYLGTGE